LIDKCGSPDTSLPENLSGFAGISKKMAKRYYF
jgi:hypothetical protein